MFEKERYAGLLTLVADLTDPFRVHWTGTGATLASDDNPIDPIEVQRPDRPNQRLDRQEAGTGRRVLKVSNARFAGTVLDGYATPDMQWASAVSVPTAKKIPHQ
ncbi:hypothetical protein BOSE21B_100046 [Bosea sp. 21B]|nr:hypothetical protein BOSE21B_100046 [Bosea sp. 21B]CAD5286897.1 hypothetical protein BOSE7B_41482 [Bosea sp. 7B]